MTKRALVTMRQPTDAFYIQSPRLQTAFPISASENTAFRMPANLLRTCPQLLLASPVVGIAD